MLETSQQARSSSLAPDSLLVASFPQSTTIGLVQHLTSRSHQECNSSIHTWGVQIQQVLGLAGHHLPSQEAQGPMATFLAATSDLQDLLGQGSLVHMGPLASVTQALPLPCISRLHLPQLVRILPLP